MLAERGFFLTLEGIDGCGKSTQAAMLAERLAEEGIAVAATREPGGTPIGEAVRALLLNPAHQNMSPACEALLYAASRAQHVQEVIAPALDQGRVVVCERFVDSSLVYQGLGLGLGMDAVAGINHLATGGLSPDLTIYFDVEPSAGLARVLAARRGEAVGPDYALDRVEQRRVDFHERVRQGYLDLVRREPGRFCAIAVDNRPPEEVARLVWEKVRLTLLACGFGKGR